MSRLTRYLLAGGALILLTNFIALLGAAYNRDGNAESTLQLSRREFHQTHQGIRKDNSGLTLELNWRVPTQPDETDFDYFSYSGGHWRNPAWLDSDKLKELSVDTDKMHCEESARHKRCRSTRSIEVYLVLENNGAAYQQALQNAKDYAEKASKLQGKNPGEKKLAEQAKNTEAHCNQEQKNSSRLFVIDAGLDETVLRNRYPDRSMYAIAKGIINPTTTWHKNTQRVTGYITQIHAEQINVPLQFRKVIDSESPVTVTINFGRRLEPWIISATFN